MEKFNRFVAKLEGLKSLCKNNLTDLECGLIATIEMNDFYEKGNESTVWMDCVLDEALFDAKSLRGAISSLVKKGIIEVNGEKKDTFISITEKGKDYFN